MQKLIEASKSKFQKLFPVDTTLFLLQFFRHPQDIGAITPSSQALADAMTRYVVNHNPTRIQKRYLEAGAGTGAFTGTLVKKLGPKDIVDIVEINPLFCERLRKKYNNHPSVSIFAGSVLDWKPAYHYDGIISSLPFNAFKADFVQQIYEHYQKIAKKGAIISYCEYMALPGIKKLFLKPSSKKAFQETLEATYRFEGQHEIGKDKVFANFPPAVVHHCKL